LTEGAARFFDAIARRYDRVYAPGRSESTKSLRALLSHLHPASRVLDLGVGTGRELPALLDAGHSPVGLDVSAEMLALCAARARPIPLVRADLWAPLPFDAGTFDAVIALHGTLAHPPTDEARRALPREVARVLRPGGVFVAELPTVAWLAEAGRVEGSGVRCLGEGRGSFADAATGAVVDVWLGTEDEWRAWLGGVMDVTFEPAGAGEMRVVGRVQR
jgi:SAM-dependent methyltransferase